MFENIDFNKKMIMGAYKKLKSYYYYDKTILYNKVRLATWESSKEEMDNRINDLAIFLTSLQKTPNYDYLHLLMKNVSLIPMPKSFKKPDTDNNLLHNIVSNQNELSKVNFYIKAPVEILILDAIWTLMISKIAYEQKSISNNIYANKVKATQLFNDNPDLFYGIDFESNRSFYPYFRQYTTWRNRAFTDIKKRYKKGLDSILITLDIKSYYYSVIFDFDLLTNILNNDSRLKYLEPLTEIIKKLHISYTAEMQKFRGAIPADCKKGQSALPIGLFSSMMLANLYLKEFDDAIEEKLSPSYYGRYVDDIILVIDKTEDMEISVVNILQKSLVKHNIIEPIKDNDYVTLIPTKLHLQGDKIRCIYFNHTEPDAMIKLLCEASKIKPSMIEQEIMPDIDLTKKTFDDAAYSIEQHSGALKVRDFLFSSNNYNASVFLNNLIRMSKNIDTQEKVYYENMEKQLNQILRFYNCDQAIEYRSAWINIFTLILINHRYDFFFKFYTQTTDVIKRIKTKTIESIDVSKIEYIIEHVKDALIEQLKLAASIALATQSFSQAKENLQHEMSINSRLSTYADDIDEMFGYAKDIRNANLFNNHILAFPLISYIHNNDYNQSLVETNLSDIANFTSESHNHLPLDERKVLLSPRFINLDEIYLLNFLMHYPQGGNISLGKTEELLQIFYKCNNISTPIENIQEKITNLKTIKTSELSLPSTNKPQDSFNKFKVAIASICLDEYKDVEPVIVSSKHGLSPQKKKELYVLLNNALDNKADMIVFPEFYLPIEWLQEIFAFSRKNSVAIISGLRYITYGNMAYNYLCALQPFESFNGFKYAIPLLREKNHYAPAEIIKLANHKLNCKDPDIPHIHLINWENLSYSNLMCYELTDIEYRYCLRNKIELLVVPELNLDTSYFSNIVESTTRDLHCFVVQVNTSKYGDSRITGPYKSMYKDIIKLKGGENSIILIGTIDLEGLKHVRATYKKELRTKKNNAFNKQVEKNIPSKSDIPKFKNPSAGFDNDKEVL